MEKFAAADARLTDIQSTAGILPAFLIGYLGPHLLSHLHPSLQSRMWWNAAWKFYPLWVAIIMYTLNYTKFTPNTVKQDRIERAERDIPAIRRTMYVLTIISAAVWWYTITKAPVSVVQIFFPQHWNPPTERIDFFRGMLQYDEIWGYGSAFLWLLYSFSDLKSAGMLDQYWFSILGTGMLLVGLLGPGGAFNVGWLYREGILASRKHKDAVTLEKLRRESNEAPAHK
jgi:hypothetical protein